MARYVITAATGLVVNITEWDGIAEWTPGDGLTAIASEVAQIGWTYDGETFSPREDDPQPYDPRRVSKIDFARLFTGQQEVQVNRWNKICKSVPPEEYDDPLNALTLTVERILKAFDRPLEFIELNHSETRQGLEILAHVGVFGDDPVVAASEVERIVSGVMPL